MNAESIKNIAVISNEKMHLNKIMLSMFINSCKGNIFIVYDS